MRICLLLMMALMASEPWQPPEYTVYQTRSPIKIDGKLDEPSWFTAPATSPFHFTWYESGKKEQTVVKMLWDSENLYIGLVADDEFLTARHKDHDGKVFEDDCFEIMIAPHPSTPNIYFNVEWNVLGAYVDNHRPNGPDKPRAPVWDAEGVEIAGTWSGTLNDHSDRDRYWITEAKIPLRNFAKVAGGMTKPGDRWHINLNRHGGEKNVQYSQWSKADTAKPAFHTPHRFGRITFSGEAK